jgi:hypothetical protein
MNLPPKFLFLCYTEAKRLQEELFLRFVEQHRDLRFLFVDDGSTYKRGVILEASHIFSSNSMHNA